METEGKPKWKVYQMIKCLKRSFLSPEFSLQVYSSYPTILSTSLGGYLSCNIYISKQTHTHRLMVSSQRKYPWQSAIIFFKYKYDFLNYIGAVWKKPFFFFCEVQNGGLRQNSYMVLSLFCLYQGKSYHSYAFPTQMEFWARIAQILNIYIIFYLMKLHHMSFTCMQWKQPSKGRSMAINFQNYNQGEKYVLNKKIGKLGNYINIVYQSTQN